ncbi:MAG TPA: BrnT family toxin [Xanthomonadaceae bacterium]
MSDVHVIVHGVDFVWNARKAQVNRQKHGLDFEQATEAFFDPFLRVVDASRNDEARDKLIGYDALNRLLAVVHIVLEADAIRIVSAWPATPAERELYDS